MSVSRVKRKHIVQFAILLLVEEAPKRNMPEWISRTNQKRRTYSKWKTNPQKYTSMQGLKP
jgi:hypothetical protein